MKLVKARDLGKTEKNNKNNKISNLDKKKKMSISNKALNTASESVCRWWSL